MFNENIIVQSALSAFNNSALWAPAFLWYGILASPLFFAVAIYGKNFLTTMKWTSEATLKKTSLFLAILTFLWIVLFNGNYFVLRDHATNLPFIIATIIFLISLFVSSNITSILETGLTKEKKPLKILLIFTVLFLIIISDIHTWWGPLLNICALLFGVLLGQRTRKTISAFWCTDFIMFLCATALLMQPEFFRFGQLGNLTILHLLGLLLFGIFSVMNLVTRNISPSNRVYPRAYIKLKWLLRFIVIFCIALFLLTESVPVFLATVFSTGVMCTLSVIHAKEINKHIPDYLWAITVMIFGIITTMPAITALGILYWLSLPVTTFRATCKFLL